MCLVETVQQAIPIYLPKDLVNLIVLYIPVVSLEQRKEVINELNYKFRGITPAYYSLPGFLEDSYYRDNPKTLWKHWFDTRISKEGHQFYSYKKCVY